MRSPYRLARIMLVFCSITLALDCINLTAQLVKLPSQPMSGVFWATLQVIATVTMVVLIGFWRKRIRRY